MWKAALVPGRVGQAQGGAVDDADVAALEEIEAGRAVAGGHLGVMEGLVQEGDGEASPCPGEGAGGGGDPGGGRKLQEAAVVVASLAQGGLGVEGLEEEEPEGALEGEEALAAVGAAVALLEEVVREEGGEEELEFRDGVGTWGAEASAEGGEGASEGGEEGGEHRAVVLPPY